MPILSINTSVIILYNWLKVLCMSEAVNVFSLFYMYDLHFVYIFIIV